MIRDYSTRSHLISLFALLITVAVGIIPFSTQAASVTDLQNKQAALAQQAKQAEHDALLQKSVAERAAVRLQSVTNQINDLQSDISGTQASIDETGLKIETKNQEIAELESELRTTKDQQDALIRELYIRTMSEPDSLMLFSNDTVSKKEQEQAQLTALKKSVATVAEKAKNQKLTVESARDDLVAKQKELEGLKDQQTEQQIGLAEVQQQQTELKNDAEAAEVALEAKAKQARAQQNQVERQISAELAAIVAARSKASLGGQSSGQRVARGTVIGHEGSTGNSTGPHVHFECRANNSPVNCMPYVSRGTLIYPIENFVISQDFGETSNSDMYNGAAHMGTDLAGPYGQPVYAPADGTVILKKWYGGYGNAWAMQLDNGLVVLLGHMTGS